MLSLLTILLGFVLPVMLITGSMLPTQARPYWTACGWCAALAGVQWAHFGGLAPFTDPLHSSRDWLWILGAIAALVGLLPRLALWGWIVGLGLVLLLSMRLDFADLSLPIRLAYGLGAGVAIQAAVRHASGGEHAAGAYALLFGGGAGLLILAHSAALGLYSAGFAAPFAMLALLAWKRSEWQPSLPQRLGASALFCALIVSAHLFADLPLVSAAFAAGALIALGIPRWWLRYLLLVVCLAAAALPLLLSGQPDNPYR